MQMFLNNSNYNSFSYEESERRAQQLHYKLRFETVWETIINIILLLTDWWQNFEDTDWAANVGLLGTKTSALSLIRIVFIVTCKIRRYNTPVRPSLVTVLRIIKYLSISLIKKPNPKDLNEQRVVQSLMRSESGRC